MSSRQITGQLLLESVGERPSLALDQQHTFSGVMRPEFWGVEERALSETDYKDMTLVTPERLMPDLVSTGYNRPCAVTYRGMRNEPIQVSLTPAEYGLISRNSEKLGEASVNKTLASRPPRRDFGLDVEAAGRSGIHTLEKYIARMDRYISDTLEPDIKMLDNFAEYISNPGLNRLRGDNFRVQTEWIRDHIIGDTLVALRRQRGWSSEQELRAKAALDARLFLDRSNNRHLRNWAETIAFEREYWGHKWALFKTKSEESKRYIEKHR